MDQEIPNTRLQGRSNFFHLKTNIGCLALFLTLSACTEPSVQLAEDFVPTPTQIGFEHFEGELSFPVSSIQSVTRDVSAAAATIVDQSLVTENDYSIILADVSKKLSPTANQILVEGLTLDNLNFSRSFSSIQKSNDSIDEMLIELEQELSIAEVDFYRSILSNADDFTAIGDIINTTLFDIYQGTSNYSHDAVDRIVMMSIIISEVTNVVEKKSCGKVGAEAAVAGAVVGGVRGLSGGCLGGSIGGPGGAAAGCIVGLVGGAVQGAAWGFVTGFVGCKIFG